MAEEEIIHEQDGYKVTVWPDEWASDWDPREDYKNTRIWCWHRRYSLGDKDPLKPNSDDFSDWAGLEAYIRATFNVLDLHMIRMYDHGGIGVSLSSSGYPWNCPWDSGWLGFIFITEEDIRESGWLGKKEKVTPEIVERAKKSLQAEFQEWASWIEGDVVGFTVYSPDGEEVVDSMGGFVGYQACKADILSEAISMIKYHKAKVDEPKWLQSVQEVMT